MATKPAIAYIDGHNFYHGAMKGHPPLKWLDLHALCSRLLARKGDLQIVKYFTARVVDMGDPTQSQRQDIYLQALAKHPRVQIVEGRFARREKYVRLLSTSKIAKAWVYEEKGTDVNLAAHLVADSFGDLEVALVISNDSDLQGAVDIARSQGVEVHIANPHHRNKRLPDGARNRRYRPALSGDGRLTIRRSHLESCQLTSPYSGIERPAKWT